MKYEYGVTITNELKLESLARAKDFPFVHVIDTRRGKNAQTFPISELIYRRLNNLRVGFDQMPIDLDQPTARQENDLVRSMMEPAGQILVVTNQISQMEKLCRDCHVPAHLDHSKIELNISQEIPTVENQGSYRQVA